LRKFLVRIEEAASIGEKLRGLDQSLMLIAGIING
jgi:hypothetical protein